ncbi:Endoplasmic reticulum transmembrane protein 3 [Gurleya vavrai]
MGITTQLVQILLTLEIIVFVFMLLPIPGKKKIMLSVQNSFFVKGLKHILIACYSMIFLLFLDSFYKKYKGDINIHYLYHAERNFYLTGFTLFLAIIFYSFQKLLMQIMKDEMNASLLKKQAYNQKDYVSKMMKESQEKDEKIKKLSEEITKNEALVKQAKNNQAEYFKLFEKYNDTIRKIGNETKKSV